MFNAKSVLHVSIFSFFSLIGCAPINIEPMTYDFVGEYINHCANGAYKRLSGDYENHCRTNGLGFCSIDLGNLLPGLSM